MKPLRRAIAALSLLWAVCSPLGAVLAQAPPAVPALPDAERRSAYTVTSATCICAVNFALYGDGTDVDQWIQVWVNGVRYLSTDATYGWFLGSSIGPLATIPRPINDAYLTFNAPITGTVQIVGARRPRQLSQFQENRGVAARDLNQRLTDDRAIMRELWDKTNDLTGRGLFFAPGNVTGPMPTPAQCASKYLFFDASGLNPVCNPIIGAGSFVGVGAGLVNNAGTISLAAGVDSNILNSQIATYTIATSDCGKTILAGTGSTGQFALTLPAVTGFPTNCSVLIKNGDTTNGKRLIGFPSDLNLILYPLQSVGVKIVNGVWESFYNPGTWIAPPGVTFYANPTGNDANDCLTALTACTFGHVCFARNTIGQPSPFNIQLAAGTYSAVFNQPVASAMCGILGNDGGNSAALTFITGDLTTPTNVVLAVPNNIVGVSCKDGGEVEIFGVEFTGGNGSTGIANNGQGCVVDYDKVVWGPWGTAGSHIYIAAGGFVNLGGDGETIIGNFLSSFHWNLAGNMNLFAGGPTAIPSAVSWTGGDFLVAGNVSGTINLNSWSATGAGVAGSSGGQAILQGPGLLITASNAPCASVIPGTGGCRFLTGFRDSAGDPTSGQGTTFANLPGGIIGYEVYITDGKAANCGDGSCTTWGTTVTGGGGALPLKLWGNGTNWTLIGK